LVAERVAAFGEIQESQRADVRVNGVEIEVKAASISKSAPTRRGYQFCVHRDGRRGVRAEFVVLTCFRQVGDPAAFFVIPAEEIEARKKLYLPVDLDDYEGQWADYRDRWDLLVNVLPTV
jgi:hypothetical protein